MQLCNCAYLGNNNNNNGMREVEHLVWVCTHSRGCQVFSKNHGSGEREGVWRRSTSGEVSGVVCVELHALLVREERDARVMQMVGARRRL